MPNSLSKLQTLAAIGICTLTQTSCMDAGDYVAPDQRDALHNNFVRSFDSQMRSQESSEEGLTVGPVYTALITSAAPSFPEPNWKYSGQVYTCGSDLCLERAGASFRLKTVASNSGSPIGLGYEVNNGLIQSSNTFFNGFSSVGKFKESGISDISLETWYQTSEQRAEAEKLHGAFVNGLVSIYAKAGVGAQLDATASALGSVANTLNAGRPQGSTMCLPSDPNRYQCEIGLSRP